MTLILQQARNYMKSNNGVDADMNDSYNTLLVCGIQVAGVRTYSSAGVNQLAVSGNIVAVKRPSVTGKLYSNLKIYRVGDICLRSTMFEDN